MGLPHFTNVTTHNQIWEPVYKNLFEVEVYLPEKIKDRHPNGTFLLLENTINAKLPSYPTLATKEQRYKYSTRLFVGFPDTTSVTDLQLTFNINQNDSKQMFCFRMIKDWYDLQYNNEDGSTNYKKNCIGSIIIYQHDKEGNIIRRVTYHNVQILSFSIGEDLQWGGGAEIQELSATFCADWFEDFYF